MTRYKIKELLPAMEHFAEGGDLWFYDDAWIKQKRVHTLNQHDIENIIEDSNFESRMAHALGETIQVKDSDGWWDVFHNEPKWNAHKEYRPKPKASARKILITKVCDQIARDVELEDFTAIEQLLEGIHGYDLIAYLPEEETDENTLSR